MEVSKNFILFGANHYIDKIPYNSKCWIVWDKKQAEKMSFAMCELALTSFKDRTAKIFHYAIQEQNSKEIRIHPTQKPIALYTWILNNFANSGQKILDTHGGSGSSMIACDRLGYEMLWIEKDEQYYINARNRLMAERRNLKIEWNTMQV